MYVKRGFHIIWNRKIVNNIVTLISHFPFCPLHDNFAHQTEKTFI